jgi:hypothetical protein
MPIALSMAVFDGWLQPALVLGLFIVNDCMTLCFSLHLASLKRTATEGISMTFGSS